MSQLKEAWVKGITVSTVTCMGIFVVFSYVSRNQTTSIAHVSDNIKFVPRNDSLLTKITGSQTPNVFTYRAFEHYPNCTVGIGDFGLRPSRGQKHDENKNFCSHRDLDAYFLQTGQFYGEGSWFALPRSKPTRVVEFGPEICSFPSLGVATEIYPQCFERRNISRILITGDSNARHLKMNFLEVMNKSGYLCKLIRVSIDDRTNTQTDTNYYDVPGIPHYKLHFTGCGFSDVACASELYECKFNKTADKVNKTRKIYLEYIAVLHIFDESLTIKYSHRGEFENRLKSAESTLEYLFKYYFPYHGFPDLWFYCPPFHHETWGSSLDKAELSISYVMRLFQMHLPSSTNVVFLGDATECPEKRSREIKEKFEAFWNISRIERIHEMNQLLYSLLLPELRRNRNYHVFVDATRLSCPVTCQWHRDGAHLLEAWYFKMAEYLLDLTCYM